MAPIALLLIGGVAYSIGRRILQLLGTEPSSRSEEIAFAVALGLGVLSYGVLALGLSGMLYPEAGAVLLAVGAGVGLWRLTARPVLPETPARPTRDPLAWLLAAALITAVAANFVGALAPPTGADALAYHLAAPKIWIHEHRITLIPWRWPTYGPMNVEMLYALGMLLGNDGLPSLVGWSYGVLAIVGLWSFFPGPHAVVPRLGAAAIFYNTHVVAAVTASTGIDLGIAAYTLLAALAFLKYARGGDAHWVTLSGLCAGLAAGTKYTGAAIALLLLIVSVAVAVVRGHGLWKAAIRFMIPAALAVAPWYLRSLLATGDPVYPMLTGLLHAGPLRENLRDVMEFNRVGLNLAGFGEMFRRVAWDFGPLYLAFLPASLLAWRRPQTWVLWALVSGFGLIWWILAPDTRFFLPVLPLSALLAWIGYASLQRQRRVPLFVARAVLGLGVVAGAFITIATNIEYYPVVAGTVSPRAFFHRIVPFYEDIEWMNHHLPSEARVLFFPSGGYYLDRQYVGVGASTDTGNLRTLLQDQRISHVYCYADWCELLRRSGASYVVRKTSRVRIRPPGVGGVSYEVQTQVLELTD